MDADRWKKIEDLYQAALGHPPEKRADYLAQACPADDGLRGEVQSLLAQQADSFLESAPLSAIKTLSPGAKLGNFEIVELIGRGGMGEVYRARDSRLKRDVAIKVLPAGLARDPDRIARFEREARAAGALNHPNIVAVHDIGHDDGTYWIATELVAGESLAKLIERGPLGVAKALEIATQIADGLAAAHAAGIVHRDLKPANIMVTRDGRVKILDFGLALRRRTSQDSTTLELTDEGTVLGTAGYMSPEQVRGEPVDHRSDLFSFGVFLYEMLGGKRAFAGASSVEVMHAILKEEPRELPASVPPAFDRIVRRCLQKDRDRRFQSAADLGFALQTLSTLAPPPKTPPRRAWLTWAALAAACIAVAVAAFLWLNRPVPMPRVTGIIQITRDGRLTRDTICPLLSDGSRLFFCAGDNVTAYQASIKGGETVPVTLQMKGYEYLVDLSHDGTEFLVCRFVTYPLCELWAEPLLGASPRRLGSIVSHNAGALSPDGQQVVYGRDRELHLAGRDGTEIRKLASFSSDPEFLHWSPDGRRISVSVPGGSGHPERLWEVTTDGKGSREVLPDWNPSWYTAEGTWTPDGKYFIFISQGKIWVLREKGIWSQRGGSPPLELSIGLLTAQHPLPSVDGKRLYFEGKQDRNEFLRYDIKSRRFESDMVGISGTWLEFSKDGKWITYVSVPEGALFRAAADGSQRLQLTWPPLYVTEPRWSPDGKEIAFMAAQPGKARRIYIVPAEGGSPRQVTNGETALNGDNDPSWSPDGSSLAFGGDGYEKPDERAIHVVDLKTSRVSTLAGSEGMWSPRWSPDGQFVAGVKAGVRSELVLYDMRTQAQIQLPSPGAGYPNWSPDGESLLFHNDSGWWRIRIRDRKAELVNTLKGISLADWGWFAFAPNDSLITTRSTGSGDVYALDLDIR